MRKYGIPDKIIRMVTEFYDDVECAVEDQAEACEWFNIKTGVKHVGIHVLDGNGLGNEKWGINRLELGVECDI